MLSTGSTLYVVTAIVLGLVADKIVVANRLIIIIGMIMCTAPFFAAGIITFVGHG